MKCYAEFGGKFSAFKFFSQITHIDLVLPIKYLPEETRIRSCFIWGLLKGDEKSSLKNILNRPYSKPHPQGAFKDY